MGRPRKKPIEPEIVDDEQEIEIAPRTAKRKHTVEMEYVEEVPIDESGEVITDDDDNDIPEVAERKAYVKSERERIRDKLKKAGVSSNQPLKLRVDRLPNYKVDGASGMTAEKAFCFAMDCDENFITNGDILLMEIQKRCGPGDYWITVRYKNSILDTWKETISGATVAPVMVTDPANPSAPPTVVYQQAPNGQPQGDSVSNLLNQAKKFNELREALVPPWMMKTMDKAPAQAEPPKEPDILESAMRVMNASTDMKTEIANKMRSFLTGDPPEPPSAWAVAIQETFKHVGPILPSLGMALAQWLASKTGGGNGTAQMGTPQGAAAQIPANASGVEGTVRENRSDEGTVVQTAPPSAQAIPPYIARFLQAIQANYDPKMMAQEIKAAMAMYPQIIPTLQGMLDKRPHAVLIELSQWGKEAAEVCSLPTSAEYVSMVQDAFDELSQETKGESK